MAVVGERKREKDLSHECCVWSSFMVVRLNSRSEEGEFRKWRRHGVRRIVGNLRDTGYFAIDEESRKKWRCEDSLFAPLEIFCWREATLFRTGNCARVVHWPEGHGRTIYFFT